MRRGIALLLSVTTLATLAPAALGQYPYPYGPAPMPYAPMPYGPMPYGPMPMPGYGPAPMMARPMPYPPMPMPQPMPMWQAPAPPNTKVFVYGPLTDDPVATAPEYGPMSMPAPSLPAPDSIPSSQVVQTRGGARSLPPTYCKADVCTDGCGPDGACAPGCGPLPYEPPMRGKGHFIGDVGTFFLVPLPANRAAFSTTGPAGGTVSEFDHQLDLGMHVALGYMFHAGWGVRGSYDYLRGSLSQSTANADPATIVATPAAGPFQLVSPSATLQSGIGVDQFIFTQRLERNIADIEVMHEWCFLDNTFLFSVGGRYGRMMQSYNALRSNPGGTNGAVTVALDRDELESSNFFEGWGPTVALEVVHPLKCGWSLYGNIRGSFLWGRGSFTQSEHILTRTVNAAGVPTFSDITNVSDDTGSREVSILEMESGLQFGHRCGRCYLFGRGGFVYQRWFDVGSPTSSLGSVSFVGAVIRAGISY